MIEDLDLMKPLPLQVLSVLLFSAPSEPPFPKLEELGLSPVTQESLPFISLFLSTRITTIFLRFSGPDLDITTIASTIAAVSTSCPNLHRIHLHCLPRDPMIISAVSELALNANPRTLEHSYVGSPLSEEAREVICKLPHLRALQLVIDGPTVLPTMALPELDCLCVEYNNGHDWLQGFRGAQFGSLTRVIFTSKSDSAGNFLEAFTNVALTTPIPNTLSLLSFCTERPWRPTYRSLLPFTHLQFINVQSSCEFGCSSTIDDDTLTNLAQAMPKLKILWLDGTPCETPAGVTLKGLAALAHYCLRLRRLRIHFQVATLRPSEIPLFVSPDGSTIPRGGCPLVCLNVGRIRVPEEFASMVASTIDKIFPRSTRTVVKDGRRLFTKSTSVQKGPVV